MEPILLALIGVVSGGALWKLIDLWLKRKEPKWNLEKGLREELRDSIEDLTKKVKEQDSRIDALERESAGWQAKAFEWYQRYKILKVKALEVLIAHEVPLSEAQLALKEDDDEWTL